MTNNERSGCDKILKRLETLTDSKVVCLGQPKDFKRLPDNKKFLGWKTWSHSFNLASNTLCSLEGTSEHSYYFVKADSEIAILNNLGSSIVETKKRIKL